MNRQTANRSATFDEFTTMMQALLKAAWGKDWGTFCEAFPNGTDPQTVKFPVITYMLKAKTPGTIGKGETREIKPRYREFQVNDEEFGGPRLMNVFAQVFDCEVVFECWEENNAKVGVLAERFEDFMMTYRGYFMENGVGQIIFQTMNNNSDNASFKDGIVCRKFSYLVRLEKHVVVPSDVIEKVTGVVSVIRDTSDDSIDVKDSINFN